MLRREDVDSLRLLGLGALGAFSLVDISGGHGWWELWLMTPLLCVFLVEGGCWLLDRARCVLAKRKERPDA